MRRTLHVAAAAALVLAVAAEGRAHCQVPCGIYDDTARIAAMREDATTIAKAATRIRELAAEHDGQSMNQLVRWTNTKEAHASNIIQVVSEYFLTQKVKPVAAGAEGHDTYLESLATHHAVMNAAMKAKQNVDAKTMNALETAIEGLASHY